MSTPVMNDLELHSATLAAAAQAIPAGQPVTMLNLLRYRTRAEYAHGTDLPPISGREAYFTRYLPAFDVVAQPYGASKPVWLGHDSAHLVAPDGAAWDDIALIEYPSSNLRRRHLPRSQRHRAILQHRQAVARPGHPATTSSPSSTAAPQSDERSPSGSSTFRHTPQLEAL